MSELSYRKLLFIFCGVSFAGYYGAYMRLPVVPLFATSLGADPFQVGLINSSFLLVAGLLSLPLGILSDRLGRKVLVVSGLLISAGTSFLLYYSRTPAQMIYIYLMFGIGLAAFAPTMMAMVADFSPPTHLGRSYGWYTLAIYGGMSLGPATGGVLAQWLGITPVFLISGVFLLVIWGLVLFFLPTPGKDLVIKVRPPDFSLLARELSQNHPLWACWLVTLGGCLGLGMFVTFVPLYAHDHGVPLGQIGLIFAVQALSNALSRLPFGSLSDKVARRSILVVIGYVGLAASLACFGLSGKIMFLLTLSVGFGVSMGLAFTAIGALISEVAPLESRGLAMGGYNTCIYLGMMLGSAGMGAVIPRIGFQGSFFLTGLIIAVTTAIFFFIMKDFVKK
jgi:MFS transporter, DHA1 family, multidrug resistance protein